MGGIHVDQHAMAWAGNRLIVGNDGGVWSTTDGGETWTDHNTTLAIAQFYYGSIHPTNPGFALAGSQDNGTDKWTGRNAWQWIEFGDGASSAISTNNPDTQWAVSLQRQAIRRTMDGGASFTNAYSGIDRDNAPFIARFKKCPANDDVFIAGTTSLWKSTNFFSAASPSWFSNSPDASSAITAVAFAPSDTTCNTYAFGTATGLLRLTLDGGGTWLDVDVGNAVPNRYVTDLAFDPLNSNILYVTLSGFDEATPSQPGHVFKTTNALSGSPAWTNVSPPVNIPHDAIALDAFDANIVYVGTDLGIWRSTDSGSSWTHMGPETGIPNVAVYDLQVIPATGVVMAFTHGRGAFVSGRPVPVLSSLSPSSALVGGPGFTLTVTGSSFDAGSIVRWNGADRPTSFVNSTQLQATIPASDLARRGTAFITVANSSPSVPISNALPFDIVGLITTVAGTGAAGFSGDGSPATSAELDSPIGIALDGSGNIVIADQRNHRIRQVAPTGIITTVVGTGSPGFSGDGGPATSAQLYYPFGIAFDAGGNLFIADHYNHRVRRVDARTGIITTVAGTGAFGFSGDGGPATSAQLYGPIAMAFDPSGNFFISEHFNHRVRRVDARTGIITTVAGTGTPGFSGDGGPATSAQLDHPYGIALDAGGNLFIADFVNHRVRQVAATGIITTLAGTGNPGFSGEGGPATSAQLYYPTAVAFDPNRNLVISDHYTHRIRQVTPAGIIVTIAGSGPFGFSGEGGPATSAQLNGPISIAIDSSGNLVISDHYNQRIRLVTAGTTIASVTKVGSANGTVTSNPAGIDCGATCRAAFPSATAVTLTASAGPGSTFAGWSGVGCSGTGLCRVILNTDTVITATFNRPAPVFALKITTAGNGQGTVTSSPAGIDCGATCQAEFSSGSVVTLTASATPGSTFTGWRGAACSGTGPCTVTLTGNLTTVVALFTRNRP